MIAYLSTPYFVGACIYGIALIIAIRSKQQMPLWELWFYVAFFPAFGWVLAFLIEGGTA